MNSRFSCLVLPSILLSLPASYAQTPTGSSSRTIAVDFKSHDGHEMLGKLVLPEAAAPRAIVIYVQTAEGATVDQKRPLGKGKTFNYFDLYREMLPPKGIGFFSYEGRGIRMGDQLPRFEKIDREVFNTATLDNKVKDVISAINTVREQERCKGAPILLMGASEGTLLAAEAASRQPDKVSGLVLYGLLATNLRENFKYIMSDGAFLTYRWHFDTNKDGTITKDEFEKDPHKYRAKVLRNAEFDVFDKDSDGAFSLRDMTMLTKRYLDAVDNDQFEVLEAWAKTSASVAVPDKWFEDHFAHQPIWDFLSQIDIPVGCFHGAMDRSAPIAAVRALEKKAKSAKKTKMKFVYFDDLDHTLNIAKYFAARELPAGHKAIFQFIDNCLPERDRTNR